MNLARLEAELEALRGAGQPDRWALAAYRLGVARSEAATGPGDLHAAVELLDRAGRALGPERSPVEHARILTAAGSCRRRLGELDAAAELFDRAADLMAGRVPAPQEAAALVNCGLVAAEAGRTAHAVRPLALALDLLEGHDDDESRRVRGAAHLNRAQAHQAAGTSDGLENAVGDYRAAAECFDDDAPQRAMALHGLGTAFLDLAAVPARGSASGERSSDGAGDTSGLVVGEPRDEHAGRAAAEVGDDGHADEMSRLATEAVSAFRASLHILTLEAFPFRHGVARHSLALAYERRGGPLNLLRAAESAEAALAVFDPRLHREHWQVTARTLARLEAAVEPLVTDDSGEGRLRRFAVLAEQVGDDERISLLRERLGRMAMQPELRRRHDCAALAAAVTTAGPACYERLMRAMIPVLMELPDPLLESMCAALCEAHAGTGEANVYDEILDRVVHDLLFSPQRVRVRDLLEAHGWIRP